MVVFGGCGRGGALELAVVYICKGEVVDCKTCRDIEQRAAPGSRQQAAVGGMERSSSGALERDR